ncbi:type II toxin-antitoxin system MqsA family antitoxin [Arsukibacterium sp. MJ3]|uniref:type II toxin-antitoxin system MqsA family antitoxin n=1 Tax=Arsukibacterium sp. MJ3 TaxID=1632859 RepID=UPI000699547D|nr:type II toxin-antitoxin system MqsA family antitoxin [Arsukibacterium sp. MJ3]
MSKHPTMCDLCQEGTLEVKQGLNTVTYKNNTRGLETSFCECDVCGTEMALPEQTRDNKRRMTAFKKEIDGLLTGFEVRALRERFGLTQAEAAKVFGGGVVAFSKYENDDVSQSEAMDKLMRLADRLPEVLMQLKNDAGLNPPSNVIQLAKWQLFVKDAANEEIVDENFLQVAETQAVYNVSTFEKAQWAECQEC